MCIRDSKKAVYQVSLFYVNISDFGVSTPSRAPTVILLPATSKIHPQKVVYRVSSLYENISDLGAGPPNLVKSVNLSRIHLRYNLKRLYIKFQLSTSIFQIWGPVPQIYSHRSFYPG